MDQRFQDEADETLISSETWVANDDLIATTQSLEQRFDTLIETDILVDSTGLTKSASGGQTTLGIGEGLVDLDRIKTADIVQTADYSTTWTGVNDKVSTVGALEARHDVVVGTSQPTTAQVGKQWLNTTPSNQEYRIWDGSSWRIVAVGQPFSPTTATIIRYVDATNGSDAVDVTGFLPQAPLQSIKRAVDLINSDGSDGSLVVVAPGVYQETLPIQIQRNNVSIVGQALRSCFVQPTQATETNTMFECNSGTLLANMTFVGLKASGTRGNSTYDSDATYGLPENQGWACAFYAGATIKKSPYIQNCTNFTDSSIDNSVKYDQTNLPAGGLGGDTTSAMTGGGILCDGSVPASSSPLRSFVVDSFTQVCLDGPGILCTNNGYAQLVSFFGTFCHYHAKALNGGQLNLSNCTTDFGRYALIAEGRSTSAQISGSSVGSTSAGATVITVDGLAAQGGFSTNQPGTTMVMEIGSDVYQVFSASAVSSNQSNVTIYRAASSAPETNIGLANTVANNTAVTFKLRSYISTGGHTFEYVGSGTDYSAHPDFGGIANSANQVIELGGSGTADDQVYNSGKVWQSSTDENGLFKVGPNFTVDQRRNIVQIENLTPAAQMVSDLTPQLGGNLDLNSRNITGTGNIDITGSVTTTADATINELTIGNGAGSGIGNTIIGEDAFQQATTGTENVAVGKEALRSATTAKRTVAIGQGALDANETGLHNTAVGFHSLLHSTGSYNSGVGGFSAYTTSTGVKNSALGYTALYKNATGDSNVAIGNAAGYYVEGDNNTILGCYTSTTSEGPNLSNTIILAAGGAEKLRVNSSGSLLFGGTLPSAPSITLTAAGGGTFAGVVDADYFEVVMANGNIGYFGGSDSQIIQLYDNGVKATNIDAAGTAWFGGTVQIGNYGGSTGGNTQLDADGSAEFGGNVGINDNPGGSVGLKVKTQANNHTGLLVENPANTGNPTLLVLRQGSTPVISMTADGAATFKKLDAVSDGSVDVGLNLRNSTTGTSARFYSGAAIVGSITVTASATAYNTSSDYRLKENVINIVDGITRVKQLQPRRFNFITDADTTVDGFLAHEAQAVVPEAVAGEKDATKEEEYVVTPAVLDDDGEQVTPAVMGTRTVTDPQGIDQSKLVPLLTAALQEAIARIEELEARLTAAGM